MKQQRILITGAAGRVGSLLVRHWRGRHALVLTDARPLESDPVDEFHRADLSDLDAVRPLFEDVDTVVHLAADPRPNAPWESVLPNNVVAAYNVFEAAAAAGCRRVIIASSVHAVAGYEPDVQVSTAMPAAPANLYGVSKVFAEALGRYFADQRDLSVICLRLGAIMDEDDPRLVAGHPFLDILLTCEDLLRLYDACLAVEDIGFGVFHGTSDNRFKRLDLSDTKELLNYQPGDDAFVLTGMVGPERPDPLFESR